MMINFIYIAKLQCALQLNNSKCNQTKNLRYEQMKIHLRIKTGASGLQNPDHLWSQVEILEPLVGLEGPYYLNWQSGL